MGYVTGGGSGGCRCLPIYILFISLFLFQAIEARQVGLDLPSCSGTLDELIAARSHGFERLSGDQREFLEETLLARVGLRGLRLADGDFAHCEASEGCVQLSGYQWPGIVDSSMGIRIEWTGESSGSPTMRREESSYVLRLPSTAIGSTAVVDVGSLMSQFLVGHPLHPYTSPLEVQEERMALGEAPILLKDAQLEGIQAASDTIDRHVAGGEHDDRFLYVGPTGVGKTEVLKHVLSKLLSAQERPLHILMADQLALIDQLAGNVEELRRQGFEFELVRWGGEVGASGFKSLVQRAHRSQVPVILVTTTKSFIDHAKLANQYEISFAEMMAPLLGSISYDEVHHFGAEVARGFIDSVVDHPESKTFLFGTTATPIHRDISIQALFSGQAFWAYLDTARSYRERGGMFLRSFREIVRQQIAAIESGELSPYDDITMLRPADLEIEESSFFYQRRQSARYETRPALRNKMLKFLKPKMKKHKKGFFATNTIDEARDIAAKLSKLYPHFKIHAIDSDMDSSEAVRKIEQFRNGEIDFLVAVRMLDEGIDIPDMTLYVDMNRGLAPRQLIQRMGRLLRLAPNKHSVDMVFFMDTDRVEVLDSIRLLREMTGAETRSPFLLPLDGGLAARFDDDISRLRELEQEQWLDLKRRIEGFVSKHSKWPAHNSTKDSEKELSAELRELFDRKPELILEISEAARMAYQSSIHKNRIGYRTAMEANEFVETHGELPAIGSRLFQKISRVRWSVNFIATASEDLLELMEELGEARSSTLQEASDRVFENSGAWSESEFDEFWAKLRTGRIASLNREEKLVFLAISRFRSHPSFLDQFEGQFREDLDAYNLFKDQEASVTQAQQFDFWFEKVWLETQDYEEIYERLYASPIYVEIAFHRLDPNFRRELSPTATEFFESWGDIQEERSRALEQRILARNLRAHILDRVESDGPIAYRVPGYRPSGNRMLVIEPHEEELRSAGLEFVDDLEFLMSLEEPLRQYLLGLEFDWAYEDRRSDERQLRARDAGVLVEVMEEYCRKSEDLALPLSTPPYGSFRKDIGRLSGLLVEGQEHEEVSDDEMISLSFQWRDVERSAFRLEVSGRVYRLLKIFSEASTQQANEVKDWAASFAQDVADQQAAKEIERRSKDGLSESLREELVGMIGQGAFIDTFINLGVVEMDGVTFLLEEVIETNPMFASALLEREELIAYFSSDESLREEWARLLRLCIEKDSGVEDFLGEQAKAALADFPDA